MDSPNKCKHEHTRRIGRSNLEKCSWCKKVRYREFELPHWGETNLPKPDKVKTRQFEDIRGDTLNVFGGKNDTQRIKNDPTAETPKVSR